MSKVSISGCGVAWVKSSDIINSDKGKKILLDAKRLRESLKPKPTNTGE